MLFRRGESGVLFPQPGIQVARVMPATLGFVPTDIAGCVLWLDASQESYSDDDPVDTWTDRSSSGEDATQGTESLRPTFKTGILNGLPIIRFDGGDRLINAAASIVTEDFTGFVVAKFSSVASTQDLIHLDYEDDGFLGHIMGLSVGPGEMEMRVAGWPAGYSFSDTTNFHYFTGTHETTRREIFEDGSSQDADETDVDATTPDRYSIGDNISGWYPFSGDMAEAIVYDNLLSSGDRGTVESYLASRYSL